MGESGRRMKAAMDHSAETEPIDQVRKAVCRFSKGRHTSDQEKVLPN